MSRTSALTTFRLIGSPANPTWPYCRPWFPCCIMFSFAGELTGFEPNGVGEGSGNGTKLTRAARARLLAVLDEAATANAKLLRDRPATHASAHVLTATFLKCLGIIPSSG